MSDTRSQIIELQGGPYDGEMRVVNAAILAIAVPHPTRRGWFVKYDSRGCGDGPWQYVGERDHPADAITMGMT